MTEAKTPKATKAKTPKAGHVFARVLKKGDKKIATGEREINKDKYYKRGAVIELLEDTAAILEDRGFVEIED